MADNKWENQPATKNDIKLSETGLRSEIGSLKTELKSDIKRLEDIVKTNTIDILHIKDDIRDIHETMATKDDISRILGAIDSFAGEARDYRRKDMERGQMLMEQNDKLQNHESRITLLEASK
ncbi:MAG: hypothetical protein A2X28_01580 [Elusimicrobia bacterium GWA2_56_46]|nr:MAG: hypothetical protein A2X28_01580 [Elusimicrobia bacterium GWA2_56_46]OGR53848.1 MAG: hypothetical protein A2X39_06980 [Elusimicrobia bacterium GWC2_56_31]HBB68319.1 hypothetical protein [Elusimicrobiota bacterium]HBW22700.1 hypothetical protein [Elusimicrobiota bacterium]